MRRDLEHLPSRAVTGFAKELWRGTPNAFRALGTALTGYHRAALQPFWRRIEQQVGVDRTRLVNHLATGGVEGMLTALPPALRWRSPTLEVDYPVDQDLVLDGRGLPPNRRDPPARDVHVVHTTRHGRTAGHTLTTLGAALLSGATP